MLTRFLALLVSVLALAAPGFASDMTISGEVYYRERRALPPEASLHVSLVSLPEAQSIAGASATIPSLGGSPLQFSLVVRSGIHTSTAYGLVAEIRAGNRILFRTLAPVAVSLPPASPISIMVSSYNGIVEPEAPALPEPPVDEALIGKSWRATSIGGRPVTGSQPIDLTIAPDLRVTGNAGCNQYFTEASLTPGSIHFSQTATSRKACTPELMAQEREFLSALSAIQGYELDGKVLRLLDAAGIPLIGFILATE